MLVLMSATGPKNRWMGALVGLGWGAVWGLLVPLTPLASLDRQSRDWLSRWQVQTPLPEAVTIVGIDGELEDRRTSDRRLPDFYLEPDTYAVLLERLLGDAKAKAVLLALPRSFNKVSGIGEQDRRLRAVIDRYNGRVVLEAVPFNGEVDIFNNLLPYGDDLRLTVPLEQMVGVRQFLEDPDGIVRRSRTGINLERTDSGGIQTFFSVDFLAVRKFLGRSPRGFGPDERIHYYGPAGTFERYPVERICPPDPLQGCSPVKDSAVLKRFAGKLVIVGHVDGHPEASIVQTPFGPMDALNVHANLAANLLQGRADRMLPPLWDLLLILGFGVLSGWCLDQRYARWLAPALLVGFAAVMLAASRAEPTLLLPVLPPLAAFVFTGNTLFYLRARAATRARLTAQQEEINRLRRAEREAILKQAKKLLFRVATDIHDRPLQELKLVMDNLEELLLILPAPSPEAHAVDEALAALQQVGRAIRVELNDLRQVAAKLEITPSLKDGLHAGLHAELDRLLDAGELTLTVERDIMPLEEPSADSTWLDAREDLFRFFKEALVNVIRHAQPHGAGWLRVELAQQGYTAHLVVENDGPFLTASATGGGYGTKIMNTIAGELPGGSWQRTDRAQGGVTVALSWRMPTAAAAASAAQPPILIDR
jgi:signal transduction histidine kinase